MPKGGDITLKTTCHEIPSNSSSNPGGRLVRLEIIDTGIGMNEQTRLRCLEPFYTTKGERGTGLGLAMVYGIIQRLGAELNIESVEGQGTTFRIDFHNLSATSVPTAQDVAALPQRMRILIIDDDPIVLHALNDFLSEDGHEVVVANDSQLGLDLFATSVRDGPAFDVVFTDLGMPNIDGRRVAAAIKGMSKATPIIMLTGWGQRLAATGETMPNIDRLLSKPPRIHEIRSVLLSLVNPQ
jgi:CheY-like chemotaxis protein